MSKLSDYVSGATDVTAKITSQIKREMTEASNQRSEAIVALMLDHMSTGQKAELFTDLQKRNLICTTDEEFKLDRTEQRIIQDLIK